VYLSGSGSIGGAVANSPNPEVVRTLENSVRYSRKEELAIAEMVKQKKVIMVKYKTFARLHELEFGTQIMYSPLLCFMTPLDFPWFDEVNSISHYMRAGGISNKITKDAYGIRDEMKVKQDTKARTRGQEVLRMEHFVSPFILGAIGWILSAIALCFEIFFNFLSTLQ
jgi:hypothetical protein